MKMKASSGTDSLIDFAQSRRFSTRPEFLRRVTYRCETQLITLRLGYE